MNFPKYKANNNMKMDIKLKFSFLAFRFPNKKANIYLRIASKFLKGSISINIDSRPKILGIFKNAI